MEFYYVVAFAIMIFGTIIVGLVSLCKLPKEDKKLNRDVDSKPSKNVSWDYEKGSEEEKEELKTILLILQTVRMIVGLCETEKNALDEIMCYIKREIGDD